MIETLSNAFFQQMCDDRNAPSIIVKANNPKFEIIACNEQFEQVSGTSCNAIVGISMSEIHSWSSTNEDSAIQIHDALNQVINTKVVVHLPATRYDLPANDGTGFLPFWWQPSYEPILDANGEVTCIFCTVNQLSAEV